MNPALAVIVILICIFIWIFISGLFKPLGRWLQKKWNKAVKEDDDVN